MNKVNMKIADQLSRELSKIKNKNKIIENLEFENCFNEHQFLSYLKQSAQKWSETRLNKLKIAIAEFEKESEKQAIKHQQVQSFQIKINKLARECDISYNEALQMIRASYNK